MLKETFCVLLLIVISEAAHPKFKIVNASGANRGRVIPYGSGGGGGGGHIRHHYEEEDDDDEEAEEEEEANGADGPTGYRSGFEPSGGLDPVVIRAARLNAYRAALLRSIRQEEEFNNQHASRFAASDGGGSGGGKRGGSGGGGVGNGGPPQRHRTPAYYRDKVRYAEGSQSYRSGSDERNRPHKKRPAHSGGGGGGGVSGYRNHRIPVASRELDDDVYY